ncbi:uncharacterized protein LOC115885174 [Sitophilus oryzae]|uniref:Uncharacterized protein LOC115885174 n=1 Tax=Sitophilus oryzae TaxID=7048 RepID=A0A6J2Y7Q4_SITOR|nr:uncharacterized protein LOC115885174 [Sitophilus oryzae]
MGYPVGTRLVYIEVTGKHKPRTCTRIVDGENKPILTEQKLEEVWTNYIRELFDDGGHSFHSQIETENGPDIMISEIERALKNTKNGKAAGPDNIYPELIKLINGDNLKLLVNLFNSVYNTGNIPRDWLRSTFIPIPKKTDARCDEFRLISLMSQVLKLFLKVLHNRIRRKCELANGILRGTGDERSPVCAIGAFAEVQRSTKEGTPMLHRLHEGIRLRQPQGIAEHP